MSIFRAPTLTVISCLLIIGLLFSLLPQTAYAQSDPLVETTPEYIQEQNIEPIQRQRFRVSELIEKRERDKKYFLNSDGTTTVEIHSSSIHYLDAGVWRDIDNTIILDESTPEKSLRNKANGMTVRFAPRFTGSNELVSINLAGKSMSITPAKASAAQAESGSSASAVIYRDIYPDIDFEYILGNDIVKENIIVNKYTGQNSFSFIIRTTRLTPKLRGKEVYFLDNDGDEVFFMPAPFMYDQIREECYDFAVSLEVGPNCSYILTYSADDKWLTDSARVYPVIIDPVVWTLQSPSYYQTRDTFVDSKNPTATNQFHAYLKTGHGSGTHGITRSYIMFPTLPVIKAADEIISAELWLSQSWTTSSTVTVNLHQVMSEWDPANLTWESQPTWDPRVMDYERCKDAGFWRIWNVTPAVKYWYHSGSNNGLLIKHADETEPILDLIASDNASEHLPPASLSGHYLP